jgi:hypothetical protein
MRLELAGQLVPAQRPTDGCCARGRQICPQHSLHLPSTRSRRGGDELGLDAGPVRARTALQGRMQRAQQQQHGSMALNARVLCRCGGDGRAAQPTPNVVPRLRFIVAPPSSRLDPKEAAAEATEATCARHRRHATVSSASLRSPWWGRAFGAQVRCRRLLHRRLDGHGSKEALGALQGDCREDRARRGQRRSWRPPQRRASRAGDGRDARLGGQERPSGRKRVDATSKSHRTHDPYRRRTARL